MTPLTWPCPLPHGGTADEYALAIDRNRPKRLLIVPALFDEANRLRRFTVEVMRRLDAAGIDSFLPDLPGTNESLQPLQLQTPRLWLEAFGAVAHQFGATHALGIRGGCLFTPTGVPTLHYAPVKAASILRHMFRARILSSREAGRDETREGLEVISRTEGTELAGYHLVAEFVRQFEPMIPGPAREIGQDLVGGSGLWLRAEPSESAEQSDALAQAIAAALS